MLSPNAVDSVKEAGEELTVHNFYGPYDLILQPSAFLDAHAFIGNTAVMQIDKIREIFDLINNSLEEVMNSLRVFVEKRYVDFEQKIQEKWNETLTIPDSYKKGKVLEELLVLIFSTVERFIPSHRIRTETEEIDISVRNESKDSFWSKFTPFVLIECKNWSTDCGKNEVVSFRSKLVNRFGLSHIGFLVSINGFRNTVTKEILRGSQTEFLVVPINGKMLKELVLSKDRSELKSFVSESTFT